jgi:hypothetical protein
MKLIHRGLVKTMLAGATLLAVQTFSGEAKADPHTHDGFYLHFDMGFGYLSSSVDVLGTTLTYSGVTFPSSLLLGGTVGPVAFGGGFFTDYAPSPSVSAEGGSSFTPDDADLYLAGIGMFADIYPNPKEGLHILPFVGFAALEATSNGDASGSDPTGLVLSVGVGYDFWVSANWSAGVMGRFAYAPLSMNNFDYTTIAPALLGTITYH